MRGTAKPRKGRALSDSILDPELCNDGVKPHRGRRSSKTAKLTPSPPLDQASRGADLPATVRAISQPLSDDFMLNNGPTRLLPGQQPVLSREARKTQEMVARLDKEELLASKLQEKAQKRAIANELRAVKARKRAERVLEYTQKDGAWLHELTDAPTYFPTKEQFKDPLKYIQSIQAEASKFGICKIVPPVSQAIIPSSIVGRLNGDKMRFTTRQQFVHKQAWNSFDASQFYDGKTYNLASFEEMADKFQRSQFDTAATLPPHMSEAAYWYQFEHGDASVSVEYGNDVEGTAFPPRSAKDPLGSTDWNLQELAKVEASCLRLMGIDIPGVTSPMLYIGMLFATFAWHVEDHNLYSINYQHYGASKTWYGVPARGADGFDDVVVNSIYKKAMTAELKNGTSRQDAVNMAHSTLLKKSTVFSPKELLQEGVPVFRVTQNPGDYVVTFPRSYHGGFSNGFCVGEAVNFGFGDWYQYGLDACLRYSRLKRPPMLDQEGLLVIEAQHLARDDPTLQQAAADVNASVLPQFVKLMEKQESLLEQMKSLGADIKVAKDMAFKGEPCQECQHICYLVQVKTRGATQTCAQCAIDRAHQKSRPSLKGSTVLCHASFPEQQKLANLVVQSKFKGPDASLSLDLCGLTESKYDKTSLSSNGSGHSAAASLSESSMVDCEGRSLQQTSQEPVQSHSEQGPSKTGRLLERPPKVPKAQKASSKLQEGLAQNKAADSQLPEPDQGLELPPEGLNGSIKRPKQSQAEVPAEDHLASEEPPAKKRREDHQEPSEAAGILENGHGHAASLLSSQERQPASLAPELRSPADESATRPEEKIGKEMDVVRRGHEAGFEEGTDSQGQRGESPCQKEGSQGPRSPQFLLEHDFSAAKRRLSSDSLRDWQSKELEMTEQRDSDLAKKRERDRAQFLSLAQNTLPSCQSGLLTDNRFDPHRSSMRSLEPAQTPLRHQQSWHQPETQTQAPPFSQQLWHEPAPYSRPLSMPRTAFLHAQGPAQLGKQPLIYHTDFLQQKEQMQRPAQSFAKQSHELSLSPHQEGIQPPVPEPHRSLSLLPDQEQIGRSAVGGDSIRQQQQLSPRQYEILKQRQDYKRRLFAWMRRNKLSPDQVKTMLLQQCFKNSKTRQDVKQAGQEEQHLQCDYLWNWPTTSSQQETRKWTSPWSLQESSTSLRHRELIEQRRQSPPVDAFQGQHSTHDEPQRSDRLSPDPPTSGPLSPFGLSNLEALASPPQGDGGSAGTVGQTAHFPDQPLTREQQSLLMKIHEAWKGGVMASQSVSPESQTEGSAAKHLHEKQDLGSLQFGDMTASPTQGAQQRSHLQMTSKSPLRPSHGTNRSDNAHNQQSPDEDCVPMPNCAGLQNGLSQPICETKDPSTGSDEARRPHMPDESREQGHSVGKLICEARQQDLAQRESPRGQAPAAAEKSKNEAEGLDAAFVRSSELGLPQGLSSVGRDDAEAAELVFARPETGHGVALGNAPSANPPKVETCHNLSAGQKHAEPSCADTDLHQLVSRDRTEDSAAQNQAFSPNDKEIPGSDVGQEQEMPSTEVGRENSDLALAADNKAAPTDTDSGPCQASPQTEAVAVSEGKIATDACPDGSEVKQAGATGDWMALLSEFELPRSACTRHGKKALLKSFGCPGSPDRMNRKPQPTEFISKKSMKRQAEQDSDIEETVQKQAALKKRRLRDRAGKAS